MLGIPVKLSRILSNCVKVLAYFFPSPHSRLHDKRPSLAPLIVLLFPTLNLASKSVAVSKDVDVLIIASHITSNIVTSLNASSP